MLIERTGEIQREHIRKPFTERDVLSAMAITLRAMEVDQPAILGMSHLPVGISLHTPENDLDQRTNHK